MNNWTEYTGSDEQIAELVSNTSGYIVRNTNPNDTFILASRIRYDFELSGVSTVDFEYWLIPDDPLRDMKIRQAMTGQDVWVKMYLSEFSKWIKVLEVSEYREIASKGLVVFSTTQPFWNIPNAEYSFTEFKD